MWNFNMAALAQVSSFVGLSPVQTPVFNKVEMNVHAASGMCLQSSAWHRRLKNKSNFPRPDVHGAPHLARAGGSDRSFKQSGNSLHGVAGSVGVPTSAPHSAGPWSEPDGKPLLSSGPGSPDVKARTPSALGSVCEGGLELGIGFDYETGDWKDGHSLRRRLDESAWKLSHGVLIEERAKIDSSTLSSLFAEGKQEKVSSQGKNSGKSEDSLVFKVVKSNGDMNLMLEEECSSTGGAGAVKYRASKNVQQVPRNEATQESNLATSDPGSDVSVVGKVLEASVARTGKNLLDKYSDFASKVGAALQGLPANLMMNELDITWESAVTEAAGNLQRRKELTSRHGSHHKKPVKHNENVESQLAGEKDRKEPEIPSIFVHQRTKIAKVLENDKKVIVEGMNWVLDVPLQGIKGAVEDLFTLKHTAASSAPSELLAEWPQPSYPGLSGTELLTADVQALKDYVGVVQKWCALWFIPLQETYDPEQLAIYFNLRPHLLLFRLFEVSAAFGFVALQSLIDKAIQPSTGATVLEDENANFTIRTAEILKLNLLRLGPTFIKVAQSLSARPDLIGPATAKVLAELQDRLPPFPTGEAIAILEEELGKPVNEVFSYLSDQPVAAASFGQVYKGRTLHGDEVAVKVQRPGLLFLVARDVYILRLGLGLVRKVAKMNSDISLLADELGRGLYGEMDYHLEAANARKFQEAHAHLKYVVVPRTLPALTTRRVLTMEWMHGERPGDLQALADDDMSCVEDRVQAKLRLVSMVNNGVQASLVQLLETGVMHADPHPGNILFTKCGNLGFLDFGLLCQMERKHQDAMFASIAHLVNGEWRCLVDDLANMDILKPTTNLFSLQLALEDALGNGPDAVVQNGMANFRFGQVAGKLWKVALKFRFRLPPYYTLVLRSLASLEGVALTVDPDFKIFSSAYPYVVSRLLTDTSPSTRQVLHSLLLDENREFRWDRIGSLVSLSRETSMKRTSSISLDAEVGGAISASNNTSPSALQPELTSTILKLVLSAEGRGIRRVLLESDTRALARAFTSENAAPLRRRLAELAADVFYQDPTGMAASVSYPVNGEGEGARTQQQDPMANASSMLKNRRLHFLMAALLTRLKGCPILMLRVGWVCTTMVCFAAVVAFRRVVAGTADRLLKKPVSVKQRLEKAPESVGGWTPGASSVSFV